MKAWGFFALIFFLSLVGSGKSFPEIISCDTYREIQDLEERLADLYFQREAAHSLMQKHTANALRWQFQHDNQFDARRSWRLAQEARVRWLEISREIERIEGKRNNLLFEDD